MTQTWFILIAVALGVVLGAALLALIALALDEVLYRRRQRRRQARRAERIEQEGHDALQAWCEPIPMMFPQRAPRNGDPWEEEPREETSA